MTSRSSSIASSVVAIAVGAIGLFGCDDDGDPPIPPDSSRPTYWQPVPGEAANWDIQLAGSFDVAAARAMYALDLWDVTTATTLAYLDGAMVAVPAGPLGGKVLELKTRGGRVVCDVEAGAIRLDDPDAARFPGHSAAPPDRPTAPAAGSAIGWSVIGDPMTRYLDLRSASRAMWRALLFKRFELAAQLGCDAVAVAWGDQLDAGFPLVPQDVSDFFTEAANELHRLKLSAGIHTRTSIGEMLAGTLNTEFDFAVVERCAEFDECDFTRSFAQDNKAVFAIDFDSDGTTDRDGDGLADGIAFGSGCAIEPLPDDWIHKQADAAFRATAGYRMARADCP